MLPRLPWLVLILIAAALLAVGADAISNDTWLGIAGGREVIEHGFGTANTWTRFGTHGWADQQWGAHLVFYGVWRLAGAQDIRHALQPFDTLIAIAVVLAIVLFVWWRLGTPGRPGRQRGDAAG